MKKTPPSPADDPSTRKKKAKKAAKKTVELRGKFKAAHARGMKALTQHDYDTLGRVIAEESQILQAQGALIKAQADALSRTIAVPGTVKKAKKAKKKRRR